MSSVELKVIVPLDTARAGLGDTFAFGGFECQETGRHFYCGQAFPLTLLRQPDWTGQVHCPYCREFHDYTRSERVVDHDPIAAVVSDEQDGRRTVSFQLPAFPADA